jgi:hypothetical protein
MLCGVSCDRRVQRLTLILHSCCVSSLQPEQWARIPVISCPCYIWCMALALFHTQSPWKLMSAREQRMSTPKLCKRKDISPQNSGESLTLLRHPPLPLFHWLLRCTLQRFRKSQVYKIKLSVCALVRRMRVWSIHKGADKSFAQPGRKQATATKDFDVYILFIIIIGWILVLYIYICITRLASNEIFSPSNKIHREVGRAKDLSAPQ